MLSVVTAIKEVRNKMGKLKVSYMEEQEVILQINDLHKNFGEREVLNGIDLSLHKGEVVVVLGPSGCGKSTLLRCVNGLEAINGGDIVFEGRSIYDKSIRMRQVRQKIGMVFQSYDLFNHMTVIENILLGPMKAQKREKQEVLELAEVLLKKVGLEDRKNDYPRQLSGGQKQRIAIVRSLCMNPDIILFDEVTAALDPEMVREVLDVILDLAKQGMTMIMVTHEMNFAKAVAHRIIFVDNGKVVEESTPQEFFTAPKTDRAKQFLNKFEY